MTDYVECGIEHNGFTCIKFEGHPGRHRFQRKYTKRVNPVHKATKPRTMTVRVNLSITVDLDEYEAEYGEAITRDDIRSMVLGAVTQDGVLVTNADAILPSIRLVHGDGFRPFIPAPR